MVSNQSYLERELKGAQGFFIFWYLRGPLWFWNKTWETIGNFEGVFAVRSMTQHIGEPIFQDYTRTGRILGFFIRIIRILVGIIFYVAIIIIFAMATFIWIIIPPVAVWNVLKGIV